MAIAAVTPVAVFSGTSSPGTSGPFSLSNGSAITFSLNSHIKVYRYDTTSDTAPVLLVENTDYTLTGGPDSGSITLTSPQTPLLTGEKLYVYREQPVSQSLDLASGADFSAAAVEARLDRLTEMVAENRRAIGQSVRFTTFATDGIPAYPIGAALGGVAYLTGTEATPVWATYSFDPADLALVADALTAINLVAADLSGADTIGIVASISADVTTVAGIAADVSIVADNMPAVLIVSAAIDDNLVYTQVETDALLDDKLDASAVSAFGLTLIDDVDAATARTTLGVPGLNVANTLTEGLVLDLAGSETADALTINVGATDDLRTTVASTGYVGSGTTVYANPDGSGDGLTIGVAGQAYFKNGSRGIVVGGYFLGRCDTDWAKGSGSEAGAQGAFFDGYTSKSGSVFGIGVHANSVTTAGALMRAAEFDTISTANSASKINLELVSPNTDTGATSGTVAINGGATVADEAAIRVSAIGSGVGYNTILMTVKPTGGAQPVPAAGSLWIAGGFTAAVGLDWRSMTFSTAAALFKNAQSLSWRNAADSATFVGITLDASDLVAIAAGKLTVNPSTGAAALAGDVTINGVSSTPLTLNRAAGNDRYIRWQSGGSLRWNFGAEGTAESGSNAGSDFQLARYSDAGAFLGIPFIIERDTGYAVIDGVYNSTTASAANVFVASGGLLSRSTSALKYKKDVEPLTLERALAITTDISKAAITYTSAIESDDQSRKHLGVAADWMVQHPELVHFGPDDQVEGFAYERAIAAQSVVIEHLLKRLEALEADHG